MVPSADLLIHDGGTIYLLRPASRRGSAWVAYHIAPDATRFGDAVEEPSEPRPPKRRKPWNTSSRTRPINQRSR